MKYNDLQRDYTLMEGDIIYLKSKKKKASKPYTVYVVKDGDSMHGISQKYGIRLKNLYKMNRKDGEYVPEIGDRLRLRWRLLSKVSNFGNLMTHSCVIILIKHD